MPPPPTPVFVALRSTLLGAALYLLLGDGQGSERSVVLAMALTISYLRHMFWYFHLFPRAQELGQVVGASVGLSVFTLALVALSASASPLGPVAYLGFLLFVLGSLITTGAELQRKTFKSKGLRGPYTGGLYALARHVNYTGEVVGWTGLALLSGSWLALAIPAVMARNFLHIFIPKNQARNRDTYGEDWEKYEKRVPWKLVPGVV